MMTSRRFLKLIVFTLFVLAYVSYQCFHWHDVNVLERKISLPSNREKVILFWTTYFSQKHFGFGLGHKPFFEKGCKIQNCRTTADKNEYAHADAIVFHIANIRPLFMNYPPVRYADQIYVFFLMENPYQQPAYLSMFRSFFNLTISYRIESDVYNPYGEVRTRPYSETSSSQLNETIAKFLRTKHKPAAWFVSHCNTPNKRESYVEALQRYITVDIYGQCGNFSCPRKQHKKCLDKLDTDYFFYFAFENNICLDYVTEKVFGALDRFVVPVVMGGADYVQRLPPKSFVNVEDFDSPKELAHYLKFLIKNQTEYNSYFSWKSHYEIVTSNNNGFCKLCELLNNDTLPYKTYSEIDHFWSTDNCEPERIVSKLR